MTPAIRILVSLSPTKRDYVPSPPPGYTEVTHSSNGHASHLS